MNTTDTMPAPATRPETDQAAGDVHTRIEGQAGRITLTRPQALNALSHAMCLRIERALDDWAADPAVALVVIDAEGPRAFCAGGDIAEVYRAGIRGDFLPGQAFWRDEYRMNAKLAEYPKPVIAFMQGFTMGGGVGLGGHASLRIIGETTQIAMPEAGIGLVPDVGGTHLLGRAPGHVGEYLAVTGARMGPADALYAGFADRFVPQAAWPAMIAELCESGTTGLAAPGPGQGAGAANGSAPPLPEPGHLADARPEIDLVFSGDDIHAIIAKLETQGSPFAADALMTMRRNAALSMEAALRLVRHARAHADIRTALSHEFRFTHRACEKSEFLEGVRAQIIDKDRAPNWHDSLDSLRPERVEAMLAPLPEAEAIPFGTPAPKGT